MFRRDWRQQVLVLALLVMAVAAAVAGSTIAVNAASVSTGEFGAATALLRLDATDATTAQEGLAAARARFGTVDVIAHRNAAVPGTLAPLDVRDQSPAGPYSKPMLAVRRGRYPTAQGEVALTHDAAASFGAPIGSHVMLDDLSTVVVGIVENPAALSDDFALVALGTLAAPDGYTVLVDRDGQQDVVPTGVPGQIQFQIYGGGSAKGPVAATALAATTLAMALVGLVAAAGFVVVAQRRQRQLGLLTAMGATPRHIRLSMVANGAIVGVVAALVGGALGIIGWFAAAPAVESAAGHRIDRLALPWGLIVLAIVSAIVMATLAAWWPARTASRLPVMSALSGRPARPRPVHRSMLVALTLTVAGIMAIVWARPVGEHVRPPLLVVGMAAVVLGSVFAAPGAIRALGLVADRMPFAPRLALRDLARYQSRAAAALAAISLGLGIAVGIVGIASASEDRIDTGNLSNRELLVQVGDVRTASNPGLTAAQRAQLDERAATVVAALGSGYSAVPLDVAFASGATEATDREPVALGLERNVHSIEEVGFPYVATPAVLALYGLDATPIDAATDLLTERAGDFILTDGRTRPEPGAPAAPVQRVSLPSYRSAPRSLVTLAAMSRHSWVAARAAWIVEAPKPLTSAQIAAAWRAAATSGLAIVVRSQQDTLAALRTGATTVGGLLALAIVAMAVGLIRGESARDIRTLTATGASARTRRALTASTAGALAALGAVLGTVTAYTTLFAALHSQLRRLVPVPVTHLLVLVVGLPVVAALAGWLLAGRTPRTFSRQALD